MTEQQVNQIVTSIENLTYQIENLVSKLQGDGGHTIGDSLEGIMIKLLQEEKK